MIVNGKQIAADILARAKARAAKLSHPPQVVAIVGSETSATLSYLGIKQRQADEAGCSFTVVPLGAAYDTADAVLIQLPLPADVDTKAELDKIPVEKDADVLSSAARAKFEKGDADALLPPVVGAVAEILALYNVNPKDKRAVVLGDGWLVGNPCASWLEQQGAEVFHISSKGADLSMLALADIIISGAGDAHVIKPDMIKEGVVLIDAGTSESGGTIAGDADPACADKCSVFTPVPGGVGPIAVAKLFDNAVTLAERILIP